MTQSRQVHEIDSKTKRPDMSIARIASVDGLRFCPPLSVQRKCPHAGDGGVEQKGMEGAGVHETNRNCRGAACRARRAVCRSGLCWPLRCCVTTGRRARHAMAPASRTSTTSPRATMCCCRDLRQPPGGSRTAPTVGWPHTLPQGWVLNPPAPRTVSVHAATGRR